MQKFSVQRYVWDHGWVTLGPVLGTCAASHRAAAERLVGNSLVDAGALNLLAVKVWRYGRAKQESDVLRYWSPDRSE